MKLVVDGDLGDTLLLDGIDALTLNLASLPAGWTAPAGGTESEYLGTGTNYLKLTNGTIDLYIHEDMASAT